MLWPYDEVTIEYDPNKLETVISTPWLTAKIQSREEDADDLASLQMSLRHGTLGADHLPLVNRLFAPLAHLPFCYMLPRDRPEATDEHRILDDSLLEGSMTAMLEAILRNENAVDPTSPSLSRREWNWDVDAALDFADFHGKIDPESLLSVIRRYHSLELLHSDRGHDLFKALRAMDDPTFKTAMAKVLRQNHYVTQKCQQALAPAAVTSLSARPLVEEFQREERGHDKLLERSITSLELQPESIPVSDSTQTLMSLLEYCAGRNFLAFCMAVDAFERSNFEDNDPMAQVLIERQFEKAAQFINAHKNINDHGDHENVAVRFLFAMKACDKNYAREAVRLMELLSLVMCSMSQSL